MDFVQGEKAQVGMGWICVPRARLSRPVSVTREALKVTARQRFTLSSLTPALEQPHRGITASNSAVYAPFLEKQTVVASSAMHV